MEEKIFNIYTSFSSEYEIQKLFERDGIRCREIIFKYKNQEQNLLERKIIVDFSFPMLDICGRWFPSCGFDRSVKADWFPGAESMTSISAPVICFYNQKGENKHTIALSEIKQKITMKYGVHEEDGTMLCRTEMILPKGLFGEEYRLKIWENTNREPYWKTLSMVNNWWKEDCNLIFMEVPDAARKPLYSFWYSRHQQIDEKIVENESRLAVRMGFSTIIVDDGWQTDDNNRGYSFCGDWEPAAKKFPDFPAHVKRVQDMGLKYLMWFSVPYIGKNAKMWPHFKDKLLYYDEFQQAGILDLRYPTVREYLKGIYIKAVKIWNIDGLKLDFIDEFYLRPESPEYSEGMDFADIQEALDVFLTQVMEELKTVRQDILIEFRQRYIGPRIRKYGNLLRVADCPGSGISNRVGSVDIRLLAGETAVHSDMLMWHKNENVKDAALQVISCLFSTVQISVELKNITEEMRKMLVFWMKFMSEHMNILQMTQIQPQEPENLYPQIQAEDENTRILVHYSRGRIVDIQNTPRTVYYVHGTKGEEVCFRIPPEKSISYQVMDCMGNLAEEGMWTHKKWDSLIIPTGGMIRMNIISNV